jgi:chloramphenicol O-acetyltransferase type A
MIRKIEFTSLHRKKHFDFFRNMAQPHFNLCASVDISSLLIYSKARNYHFSSSIAYILAKTANDIPQFRQRIRGDELIEHDVVHPSFTVPTYEADVFSFCDVPFSSNLEVFLDQAAKNIQERFSKPSFENEEGRDDYLFFSSIPWISFTSFQHAMHIPCDSIPRISWGKYYKEADKILMPLSVQAHHAVVDGRHTGAFFQLLQKKIYEFEKK